MKHCIFQLFFFTSPYMTSTDLIVLLYGGQLKFNAGIKIQDPHYQLS